MSGVRIDEPARRILVVYWQHAAVVVINPSNLKNTPWFYSILPRGHAIAIRYRDPFGALLALLSGSASQGCPCCLDALRSSLLQCSPNAPRVVTVISLV